MTKKITINTNNLKKKHYDRIYTNGIRISSIVLNSDTGIIFN